MPSSMSSTTKTLRFEFILAFKKLTRHLNLLFPARQALDYMRDYKALAEINVLAGKHFRDQRLSMKGNSGEVAGHHRSASGIAWHRRQSASHLHP